MSYLIPVIVIGATCIIGGIIYLMPKSDSDYNPNEERTNQFIDDLNESGRNSMVSTDPNAFRPSEGGSKSKKNKSKKSKSKKNKNPKKYK